MFTCCHPPISVSVILIRISETNFQMTKQYNVPSCVIRRKMYQQHYLVTYVTWDVCIQSRPCNKGLRHNIPRRGPISREPKTIVF